MSTRGILSLFIILALLGWVGLASFTYYNPPDAWNRWIVVAILAPTLWATLLPLAYWFHLRRQRLGAEEGVVPRAARQSALAALSITVCVWLSMVRALNWANLILLLLLIVLTEVLLSSRKRGN
jgi:hypothetical protein